MFIGLIKRIEKLNLCLNISVIFTIKWLIQKQEVIGGLAHVPVLIFIANFIKGKFGIKTEETKNTVVKVEPVKIIEVKDTVVKEEPVKIIELKNTVVKEKKAETLKELSNKLDNIQKKADKVCENVQKKKKGKKKKKRITKLRFYQASIYLELGLYLSSLHLLDLYKIQFQLEFFSCKLP